MACDGGYGPTYEDIKDRKELHLLRVAMCGLMQLLEAENMLLKAPTEAQVWWYEHQKKDRQRLEEEMLKQKWKADKETAISKLTPYERKLLGIKEC